MSGREPTHLHLEACERAHLILLRSFGHPRATLARAAGDARRVIQAALAGQAWPQTPSERELPRAYVEDQGAR